MKKPFIPFSFVPASWGLKGKSRKRAQAEYELSGEELAETLARIDFVGEELGVALEEIKFKYNHQTFIEKERNIATITLHDKTTLSLRLLDLDLQEGIVNEMEFEKRSHTLKGEPWVNVLSMELNQQKPGEGNFELDWNDIFVSHLEEAGFLGLTEEETVDMWFNQLCKNIALEAFDGMGDFSERIADDPDNESRPKLKKGQREFK